jgi:hypothetical protein
MEAGALVTVAILTSSPNAMVSPLSLRVSRKLHDADANLTNEAPNEVFRSRSLLSITVSDLRYL